MTKAKKKVHKKTTPVAKEPAKGKPKRKKVAGSLAAKMKVAEVRHVQTTLTWRDFAAVQDIIKKRRAKGQRSSMRTFVHEAVMKLVAQERSTGKKKG